MDAQSEAVARKVKAALVRAYGDRLAALYVFGSRARGDHGPDSDLDRSGGASARRLTPRPLHRQQLAVPEGTQILFPAAPAASNRAISSRADRHNPGTSLTMPSHKSAALIWSY